MLADVSLDTKAELRLGLVAKTGDIEHAVEDRSRPAQFETGPRRELKQGDYIGRYHYARSESERRTMRRKME